jgi:hypothetical protein
VQTGLSVFHNHLIVDAVGAVFPFGSEPFIRLRETLWLQVIKEAARTGRSLIFTFAPEPTVDPGFPRRVRADRRRRRPGAVRRPDDRSGGTGTPPGRPGSRGVRQAEVA